MNQLKTFVLLAALTALFGAIGFWLGGVTGMVIALCVAAAMNAFAYWNADKMILRHFRAQEADESHRDPRVRAYVIDTLDMAARAGLPAPKVYIIDNQQPNAFATGRDPAHAAVAATSGLLTLLSREEIRGVMAHELAHVKNRDTLTMTVTATIAGAVAMLANFALFFGDRRNPIAALAIMIVAPLAASLVQMAISRAREYEADRVGAEIGGDPGALARALEKIEAYARGGRVNADAERNPALAHLFIINPLSGRGADNLFSTHPATKNRIAQLGVLAERMGIAPRREPDGPWSRGKSGFGGPWG